MTNATSSKRGRPKGSRNKKTIVQEFALKRHAISDGGRQIHVTTAELVITLIRRKAMAGDVRADKLLDRLRDRFAPDAEEGGYLLAPETLSGEEWIRQAEIRNAHRRPPPEYPELD
ncbi:MAG: DUF5681 domain-containing protein [Pseudomonadota bacterium]